MKITKPINHKVIYKDDVTTVLLDTQSLRLSIEFDNGVKVSTKKSLQVRTVENLMVKTVWSNIQRILQNVSIEGKTVAEYRNERLRNRRIKIQQKTIIRDTVEVEITNNLKRDIINLVKSGNGKIIDLHISDDCKEIAVARQSAFKSGKNAQRHLSFLKLFAKQNINYVFVSDFSGFLGARLAKLLLSRYDTVYYDSVDRFSRNLIEGIKVLDYAFLKKKSIKIGGIEVTQGFGYFSTILQLVFAEYELSGKVTQIKKRLSFLLEFLQSDDFSVREMTYEEQRFLSAVQYKGIQDFVLKAIDKVNRYIDKTEEKIKETDNEKKKKQLEKELNELNEAYDLLLEIAEKL
ncbi:MAG: hypothetical protein ACTSPP_11210 [Candidatus Heimdallarchaeaceae archaeon]